MLIPALLAVMLTSALCLGYLGLSLSKSRESQVSVDAKRAFYVAESGLSEAYYGLARGLDGSVGSEAEPVRFGTGVYWVTAEDLGDRVVLHSTGLSGLGRAALSITLRKAQASVASLGLYADKGIELSTGCVVDAYDSSAGPYRPLAGALAPSARVGCNAGIELAGRVGAKPGARIEGDAIPGPSGAVLSGKGATVTGSTAPAVETTQLPGLEVEVPESAAPLTPQPGNALRLGAGDYAYTTLHLVPNASLRIDGPASVVLDQLVLDSGARLDIDGSGGPVRIAVRSGVDLAPGSTFETLSQMPERVSLMIAASQPEDGSANPVRIGATGQFHGSLYAPGAQLELPASFTVFGSAAADSILLAAGAQLHFDRALLGSLSDESLPQFVCWRVEELPDSQLVKIGLDPLLVLKANNIVPIAPSAAHVASGQIRTTTLQALLSPLTKL